MVFFLKLFQLVRPKFLGRLREAKWLVREGAAGMENMVAEARLRFGIPVIKQGKAVVRRN